MIHYYYQWGAVHLLVLGSKDVEFNSKYDRMIQKSKKVSWFIVVNLVLWYGRFLEMSKTRDRFSKGKRTENEHVRFLGISRKNAYVLTCKIYPSHTFWVISWNLLYWLGLSVPRLTRESPTRIFVVFVDAGDANINGGVVVVVSFTPSVFVVDGFVVDVVVFTK